MNTGSGEWHGKSATFYAICTNIMAGKIVYIEIGNTGNNAIGNFRGDCNRGYASATTDSNNGVCGIIRSADNDLNVLNAAGISTGIVIISSRRKHGACTTVSSVGTWISNRYLG